jgi:very-short-patch-repair endonuclease
MTVTEGRRSEMKDLAKDLQFRATSVNAWGTLAKHPWRGLDNEDLDVFQSDELQAELASWSQALGVLQNKLAELNKSTEWGSENRPKSAETFVAAVRALPEIPDGVVESIIQKAATNSGRTLLGDLIRDLENLTRISGHLSAVFRDRRSLNEDDVEDVHSALAIARDLKLQVLTVGAIGDLRLEQEQSIKRLRQGLATSAEFARLFELRTLTISDVESLIAAIGLLADIPEQLLRMREPSVVSEGSGKVLERGLEQTESLRRTRIAVMEDFRLTSLPTLPEIKNAANTLQTSGFFARLFSSKYRSARHIYESIARVNGNRRKRQPAEELTRLISFLEHTRELEIDGDLRQTAGLAFRGIDTPWPELLLISRWASKVRRELPNSSDGNNSCREVLLKGESGRLTTILKLSRAEGLLDAIKVFLETEESKARSLESLWETSEMAFNATGELTSKFRRLGLSPNVVSSDLEAIGVEMTEMIAVGRRLNTEEVRTLLGNMVISQTTVETLKATLKFVEGVSAADLPLSVRTKILGGSGKTMLEELKVHAEQIEEVLRLTRNCKLAAMELGRLNIKDWIGFDDFDNVLIDRLIARIDYALANRNALQPYLDFLRIERKAKSSSLAAILKHLDDAPVPYAQLGEIYEFIFFRSCADSILSNDPRLRSHSGMTHGQVRKRYQQLDRKIMELRRREIALKLMNVLIPAGNSRGRAPDVTGLALIRHQISLQRRHIALRDLFKRAGSAARALKPCFMMSPMSVAQFLDPAGLRFDIVVMDEASQIRPEDALGAIVRGGQLVVVGDPKQLPPTTFFEKVDRDDLPDDNAEEADIHDLTSQESILDLARGPYQPVRQLRWHYRSQHESLIAFSNHEFYDDRLIVFPSPRGKDLEYGVRLVSVEGIYEAGLNRAEAEAITGAAQEFMQQFPTRSLGIVAMNKPQQELIQKMMDELFATNVEAEAYRLRWENSLDAIFVKNLENVQGDERDVIFISTVYGKDAAGNFFQRLGPINGAHGHRRLNVLFTRAKQQVRLFTSMKANDLRIEPTSRWGVKALKNYLSYAQSGHLESNEITGREPDSEFERWVMEMLQESGYETVPQLGVAGYFIDLAVRHPERRGAFILGIECDGAMYHSARSVRDRDRLRQEVLERLNWNIYRIWSTDWFRNPRAEFQKLTSTLETLRASDAVHESTT